jgi:hypothetical protein
MDFPQIVFHHCFILIEIRFSKSFGLSPRAKEEAQLDKAGPSRGL